MKVKNFNFENNFGAGGTQRQVVDLNEAKESGERLARDVLSGAALEKILDDIKLLSVERVLIVAAFPVDELATAIRQSGSTVVTIGYDRSERDSILCDLSDPSDLDKAMDELTLKESSTIVVVVGTLERLIDPRPLVRSLRRLIRHSAGCVLHVIGDARAALDPNASQPSGLFRQWTAIEIAASLQCAGYSVLEELQKDPESERTEASDSIYHLRATCDLTSYASYLNKLALPPSADHLVLTSEHARAERTGGIGTYHQLVEEVTPLKRLILFVGAHGMPWPPDPLIRREGWMHVRDFIADPERFDSEPWVIDVDANLEATLQVLFIYDEIRLIEFQDYLGIGMRVAQAKRARLISDRITILTYGHGTHFYLDHAAGDVSKTRDLEIDVRERICLEQSDIVMFPSLFLNELYTKQQGLRLRRTIIQAYPIKINGKTTRSLQHDVDTLVFYGKPTPQKGYPDFCDAVLGLFGHEGFKVAASRLKRLVLMGVEQPDERLRELGLEIVSGSWSRKRALEILNEESPRAIVVLPYKGDNHPLSIFEVVEANCHPIAYAAGGLPEILPAELHDFALCEAKVPKLTLALAREILRNPEDRHALIEKTRLLISAKYSKISDDYIGTIEVLKVAKAREIKVSQGDVAVIVPNFNGHQRFLDDASFGLKNSTLPPSQLIIIDDHSDPTFFDLLESCVAMFNPIPTTIIRNKTNIGLAATRNVGLGGVSTKYVCAYDNDNIALNNFLKHACRILDENDDVDAVTSWLVGFEDGSNWSIFDSEQYRYRPLGPDLGLGLTKNTFGDAFAVYRVSALRELNGWDGSSRALWEDWQLFIRLQMAGRKVVVVPREQLLYRIRPDSMVRTYDKFFGYMRIAQTFSQLPLADAHHILRAMMTPGVELQRQLEHLRWERDKLKSDFDAQGRRIESIIRSCRKEIEITRKALTSPLPKDMPAKSLSTSNVADTKRIRYSLSATLLGSISRSIGSNYKERLIRESELFDAEWYRMQYSHALRRVKNYARHYLYHGAALRFDPGPFFSTRSYLSNHADVAADGINPLVHYIVHGKNEGRIVENSEHFIDSDVEK